MSLRLRLTLTYSLLVGLITALFCLTLYATMRENLEAEMDRRLEVRAGQVQLTIWPGTRSLKPEDLTAAKLDLSPLADLDAPGLFVQVLDRGGQAIATSDSLRGAALPVDPAALTDALTGEAVYSTVSVWDDRAVRILAVPITITAPDADAGRVVGVLVVGHSRQPLQGTMDQLRTVLLLLGTAGLMMSGLVGWLVADRGLRPLRTMSDRAAAIAERRDFSQRLRLGERRDEVGQLARTIDGLLATVEESLRIHRDFVADTSHELRNPLLATRTNLELIDRMSDPEDRAECVREAREQVERMSRLVSDLLLLGRVEARQLINRRPVALRPLVESVLHEAQERSSGQRLRLEADEDVEVPGDADRLTQVVTNLVDNALQHTPPGGTVRLSLERQGDWACLAVADTGEGIDPKHLPHIFDRFYRPDKARARAGGGSGLGLAIVKHLTEAHGGWVTAESSPGQGSCFTVWLPLRPGVPPPQTAHSANSYPGQGGTGLAELPGRTG